MRFTFSRVLREPRVFREWWYELPGRRLQWWQELLLEPGQGWLRWKPVHHYHDVPGEPPAECYAIPPLRRIRWAIGDRSLDVFREGRMYGTCEYRVGWLRKRWTRQARRLRKARFESPRRSG